MTTLLLPQHRTMRTLAILTGGVASLLLLSGCGLDRSDDAAVARAFAQRYATGAGSACELATAQLRSELADDGRCRGESQGQQPQVTVDYSKVCGDDSQVWVRVNPPAQVGKPYASLGLDRLQDGWAVDRIRATSTPRPDGPARCETQSSYSGG